MYPENQPDPDVASELRQGAGREWAEEAAEDERLTELHRRRKMKLSDVARDMANRGDRVSVEFGGHAFSGSVTAAGTDFVTIEGPGQVADIRLSVARWSVLPTGSGGDPQPGDAGTFAALLQEHSAARANIRLALPGGDMVIGRIAVVAEDHVEVEDVDERQLIVPLDLILAVVRSSDH